MRGSCVCVLALLCVAGLEGVLVPRPSSRTRTSLRTLVRQILGRVMGRRGQTNANMTALTSLFGPGVQRRRDPLSQVMRECNHPWTELGVPSYGARHHLKTSLSSARDEKNCQWPPSLKQYDKGAEDALKLFAEKTPISWVHYGDGEWFCACGTGMSMNSDGAALTGEGCREFRENLRDYRANTFFVAQPDAWVCGPGGLHETVETCVKDMRKGWDGADGGGNEWLGFTKGFYFPLVPECAPPGDEPLKTLKDRHVVLVGPKHLSGLHKLLGHKQYIEVPPHTAWKEMERIGKDMKSASEQAAGEHVTFICAGGPAMKVILFRLFPEIGHKDTMIEVGSSLDGFAGRQSRDYIHTSKYCKQYGRWTAKGVCDRHETGGCNEDMSFA